MAWDRSISSGTTMASLGWVLCRLPRRVALRFSKRRITPLEPMPSVSGSWEVSDVNASITCSSFMRSSSSACSSCIRTTSTELGRIKASSSRDQSHKLGHCHQIPPAVRSSPSRSWAGSTMTIDEAHKFFQIRCNCQRPTQSASPCTPTSNLLSISALHETSKADGYLMAQEVLALRARIFSLS